MAPRVRRRKVGLTRMDAAMDSLCQLGFSKVLIRDTVRSLLKVYGGDRGWIFIEEDSYKVVIETILENEEKCVPEDEAQEADAISTTSLQTASEMGTSDPQTAAEMETNDPQTTAEMEKNDPQTTAEVETGDPHMAAETERGDWPNPKNDPQTTAEVETGDQHMAAETERDLPLVEGGASGRKYFEMIQSLPPAGDHPRHKRKPCYGWISSDEEDDIVILKTDDSLRRLPIKSKNESNGGQRRKTRWDVKPEDP